MSDSSAETNFIRNPHRTIFWLAFPVLFSMIAEPLTGLADTFFVRQLGEVPQAALGIGVSSLSASFWVFSFLGVGTHTEIAQALGKNDDQAARRIVSLALVMAAAIGLIVALIYAPIAPSVANLLGATDATQPDAITYIRMRLWGAPAVLLMMVIMGALRGRQQMQTALYLAVTINVINVLLDPPFIFGWQMLPPLGVAGAGLASSISQWIGAFVGLWIVRRSIGFSPHFRWQNARRLLVVGSDLFIRTAALLIFLGFATRVANRAGASVGAAHQAIQQIFVFAALFLDAFAVTAQSLIGYFVGADDWSTAKQVVQKSIAWAIGTGVLLSLAFWLWRTTIAGAFVSEAAHAEFYGAWLIAIGGLGISAIAFLADGVHWGTGDYPFMRNVMLISSMTAGMFLIVISRIAQPATTLWWIWASVLLWNIVRAVLGMLRVWPGIWNSPFVMQSKLS